MSTADEARGRVRQMRDKAQELDRAAEGVDDQHEQQRLRDKARRLRDQSDQEAAMASGDIDPII
ncbi:DUF6381 family protein [Streptomyces sp. ODS05-4]|uniref:DUF6381 family protein n=1 Tax=Streptomyces sp. ODS05-4 TaxID=2944939 RepID=UPI00210A8E0B|nr:DUF6381 family protein [Streptomyces sp. ODS05-4]